MIFLMYFPRLVMPMILISDNLGKQCLWLTTKPKIKIPAEAEFTFLLVRKFPKTSGTNRNGLAAHLKNA